MDSCDDTLAGGLPHSDIHGSTPARGSPWLFAACHVLHRLLVPRHPPNALIILRSSGQRSVAGLPPPVFTDDGTSTVMTIVPRGSQSSSAQHRIQNLVRSLRRTNKIRINSHNVSEPSLSDLGAFPPCFDTRRQLSRSDINRTAGRTRTCVRFHRTRPETHQNLIHPDKEQNHHRIGD